MSTLNVRPFREEDLAWAEELMGGAFAGRMQARLGELVDALAYPGFVAERDEDRVGLITYDERDSKIEVVYIEAAHRTAGVGTALLEAVAAVAERSGSKRLWLVTTNDNIDALRFYQRRGFRMVELHAGAVDDARRNLKPSIPAVGDYGIPCRDEIVLERPLSASIRTRGT
jgi:ribosomal protein S18 acetylase RimI-like enzyme